MGVGVVVLFFVVVVVVVAVAVSGLVLNIVGVDERVENSA